MKLYIGTGVEGLRPAGYLTVDIDAQNNPDIVASAAALPMIERNSVEEIHASHVLEHFAWPQAIEPLAEWSRVLVMGGTLKLAVPDMSVLCELLARGENPWQAMANIYGGHWATPGGPQGHHFGWTWSMLTEVLEIMGFGDFTHWTSSLPEAANGWLYAGNGERIGLSLNVQATKRLEPLLDPLALMQHIRNNIQKSFAECVFEASDSGMTLVSSSNAVYAQKLHYRLIEEIRRRG